MRIHANVNPYRDRAGTESAISWLVEKGFLHRYTVDEKNLLCISNFHKHQQPHHMEAPSVLAAPPGVRDRFNHEPITRRQRLDILERDNHKCVLCDSTKDLHIDHIVPVAAGGSSENSNLRVLCKKCNLTKGKKIIDIKSTTNRRRVDNKPTNPHSIPLTPDSGLLTPDSSIPETRLVLHESLPEAEWEQWLSKRRTKRWPLDSTTLRKQLEILAEFDTETQRRMLNNSMQSNWQGVFPLKGGEGASGKSRERGVVV